MRRWGAVTAEALAVFAVVVVVYVASPVRQPSDSIGSIPLATAIVTEHTLDVASVLPPSVYGGQYQYEHHDGQVLTRYPVGPALFAVPYVAVDELLRGGVAARVRGGVAAANDEVRVASVVVAATATALFLLARRRLGRTVPALLVALVFAFGTSAWSTASRALWQHGPVMLLFALALLTLVDVDRAPPSTRRLATAGACLGFAVWCRPVAVLVLVLFAVWACWRLRRGGLALALAGAAPVAVLAVVGAVVYGDPSPLRYPQAPAFGLDVVARGLAANLVSPSRGLLVFTPVVLLGFAGLVVGARRRTLGDLELLAAGATALLVLAAACNPVWWAGFAYGPRLLTDVLPFIAVTALPLAACWPRRLSAVAPSGALALAAVAVVVGWSVVVHARGALVEDTWTWNSVPRSIDADPDRIWSWSDAQFLTGSSLAGANRQAETVPPALRARP